MIEIYAINPNALKLRSLTYLDSASGNMAVVRKSSGEGWSIIEGELWLAFGKLKLLLERINLCPICKHFFFLRGEVRLVGN